MQRLDEYAVLLLHMQHVSDRLHGVFGHIVLSIRPPFGALILDQNLRALSEGCKALLQALLNCDIPRCGRLLRCTASTLAAAWYRCRCKNFFPLALTIPWID